VTSDIPSWAGSVSAQALADLLAVQAERDWLDYKQQCDLSATRDVIELAKDAGAMMIIGGYIVVGADDHGQPAGDVLHPELFDTATLHAKLAKYLPKPFEIRSATHHYQGQSYAIVYVAPHQDGFCVFAGEGTYRAPGAQPRTVFRPGDVLARHGTRSERWQQDDIAMIKRQLRADADRVRDDAAEALRLLQAVPVNLGGSGLWLAMAVMPEYQQADAGMITPDEAQQFLQEWEFAQAPIDGFNLGSATWPGAVTWLSCRNLPISPSGCAAGDATATERARPGSGLRPSRAWRQAAQPRRAYRHGERRHGRRDAMTAGTAHVRIRIWPFALSAGHYRMTCPVSPGAADLPASATFSLACSTRQREPSPHTHLVAIPGAVQSRARVGARRRDRELVALRLPRRADPSRPRAPGGAVRRARLHVGLVQATTRLAILTV
jgi:hypothetical protein